MATDTTSVLNKDTFLDEGTPAGNNGTDVRNVMGSFGVGGAYRTIMSFTTPASLGTITQIDLVMRQTANYSGSATIEIHSLTQTGWTELGATWNKYDGTNNWASAGGDFSGTIINSFSPPGIGSDVTVNLYGGGATNPITPNWSTTYHWLLKVGNETANNVLAYASKDNGSNIPYLIITYTPSSGLPQRMIRSLQAIRRASSY